MLLDEAVQQIPILQQLSGVVGRRLVQGGLVADVLTSLAVALQQHLRLALELLRGEVPEAPVCLRGQLLEPVRPLVAQQEQHRVWVALLHQDVRASELGIGRAAPHAVRKAHPHPQGLCHLVYPVRRGPVQGIGHVVVEYQPAPVPRRRGKLGGPLLTGQGSQPIVLPGGPGGEPLRLVQRAGVRAFGPVHPPPGQTGLIVGREAPVVAVEGHLPVVGGGKGPGPVPPEGGARLPQPCGSAFSFPAHIDPRLRARPRLCGGPAPPVTLCALRDGQLLTAPPKMPLDCVQPVFRSAQFAVALLPGALRFCVGAALVAARVLPRLYAVRAPRQALHGAFHSSPLLGPGHAVGQLQPRLRPQPGQRLGIGQNLFRLTVTHPAAVRPRLRLLRGAPHLRVVTPRALHDGPVSPAVVGADAHMGPRLRARPCISCRKKQPVR